jgi:DNA-binding transcriptional ArsR family regulator
MAKRRSVGNNLKVLQKAGVVIEVERLSKEELKAVNDLTEEEVKALMSAFTKISKASKDKNGFWRAFCF